MAKLNNLLRLGLLFLCFSTIDSARLPHHAEMQITLLDNNGFAIPNAMVALLDSTSFTPITKALRSSAEGKATLANISPTSYVLQVEAAGFLPYTKPVEVDAGRRNEAEVTMTLPPPCADNKNKDSILSDNDKAEIAQIVLQHKLPYIQKPALLSLANIEEGWISGFSTAEIDKLTPNRLSQIAQCNFESNFYRFEAFDIQGGCVTVSLTSNALQAASCESGDVYEFQKRSGRWVGRYVTSFFSYKGPRSSDLTGIRASLP